MRTRQREEDRRMNPEVGRESAKLNEALKRYLAFLEARGLVPRTETISVRDAIGRISASAAYAKTPCVVHSGQASADDGVSSGRMLLQSYREIEPERIAALLASGVETVSVLGKPRVGIIVVSNDAADGSADSVAALYCAMLARWGAEGVVIGGIACKPDALESALRHAAEDCDLVLVNMDASQGNPAEMLRLFGEVCVAGIAIQPGGDTLLGAIHAVPVVCASCDPAGGIVVLEELVKPVLDWLLMRERTVAESVCVKMGIDFASAPDVREFVRARLGFDPVGSLSVLPIAAGEIDLGSLDRADCILDVPFGCTGYAAGERAHVRLLKPIDRIARTIRICGCYDPFLDEAADELRRADIRAYVAYDVTDNERALEAVQRGECQLCGLLLPDHVDGIAYVKQHNPEGGMALVEGVCITQDDTPLAQMYDLLISLSAMENPQVRAFLRVLGSEGFLRRLDARGGYRYDKPGKIKKIWP